jgi:hypothetical protein
MHVLRTDVSEAGKRIRLALRANSYDGAKPFFEVAYDLRPDRRPDREPHATLARSCRDRARAEWLYERFMADVTDPASLALRPMPDFDPINDVVIHPTFAEVLA